MPIAGKVSKEGRERAATAAALSNRCTDKAWRVRYVYMEECEISTKKGEMPTTSGKPVGFGTRPRNRNKQAAIRSSRRSGDDETKIEDEASIKDGTSVVVVVSNRDAEAEESQ